MIRNIISTVKIFLFASLIILFCLPMQASVSFDADSLRVKVEEINSFKLKKPIYRTRSESKKLLEKVINRIEPFAVEICLATRDDIKKCKWELEVVSSNQFNAYASGDNKISFYTGLVRGVYYEEELAFVVAHEIAHHIGNHLNESLISTLTGAFLGALVASESDLDIFSADIAQTGAYIGRFSGSRKRESEADFISTIILKKAGYDLEKARIGLIRMTRTGLSKTSSKFLDSHPTGPERLIAYDEITNSL